MTELWSILESAKLRRENVKIAIKAGYFGSSRAEIIENIKKYNQHIEPVIVEECQKIQQIIKEIHHD